MKQLSVISNQLSVKTLMIALVLSLITIHTSLITAFGEDIQARAAVVMEASTGRVLYAKNPELRLMPASTTKLMTALIAVEKVNLKDVVTISRNAVNVAPTKSGFKEGDKVTVETLLYAALMKSANDAAVALAEAAGGTEEQFVQLMNRKAIALGATDTKFINPNGLPGHGQYTTAYDLSKIMRQAIKHPVLKEILGTRAAELSTEAGKTVFVKNTNKLLWSDDELLGGKTGFTNAARHCFVCAGERENNTLIVALLGAPSRTELWKETEDLMAFGSKVMKNQEEPVVYLTRSDYDDAMLTKAAYTRKVGGKARMVKGKRVIAAKAASPGKSKMVKAKYKVKAEGKSKVTAKAKLKAKSKARKNTKMMVKAKKAKKTNMAKKGLDGING
ncbi:MAG: D-alanyl-D-alanine carboxypeptidase [Nitrospirae bacterium]|nr:D-alanyl-D-alanine carboxypeptidase [Nitrospirota bacterium]